MLTTEIKNDAGILQQVRIFIEQLRSPFGFLTREIAGLEKDLRKSDMHEKDEETKGDHPHFAKEKQMEQLFDN